MMLCRADNGWSVPGELGLGRLVPVIGFASAAEELQSGVYAASGLSCHLGCLGSGCVSLSLKRC